MSFLSTSRRCASARKKSPSWSAILSNITPRRINRVIDTIPSEAMNAQTQFHWPGNIRKLQNVTNRAVILSKGPVLNVTLTDLRKPSGNDHLNEVKTLEEMERRHILYVLDATRWVSAGEKGAAAILG